MKKKVEKITYFFVDESGDPYFYDRNGNFIVGKEGCSKILILGFIKTDQPDVLRKSLEAVRNDIANDLYLKDIPSVQKSLKTFHATDDCPEVREKVFKTLVSLPFKAEFIVARKNEAVFIKRHQKRPNLFYDDLISKLFENQLHQSDQSIIYFAVRGNRARQLPLEDAIRKSVLAFESKWGIKIETQISIFPQKPEGEPALQIIDYMNWTIQRAFIKGEMRYFDFMTDKISLVVDIYDFDKYPKNFYNRKNRLDITKISPL